MVGCLEFVMDKLNHLTIESLLHDPRSHMVNRLIFNGVTDIDVLISITDKLLGFIGENNLFDKSTPEERSLSNWRGDMVGRLMHQGLTDADVIINTINQLYAFLVTPKKR